MRTLLCYFVWLLFAHNLETVQIHMWACMSCTNLHKCHIVCTHTYTPTHICMYMHVYILLYAHTHTGQYPQINDDLVNSHHLLLCCMDMLFCAAVEGKRRDLLNPDCSFLPEDFSSSTFTPSEERMCVLTELCTKYGGRCGCVHSRT